MHQTCENWHGLVNSCVYYACQAATSIKFTRCCLTQWISKLLGSFEIHWVRQYFINVVLFGIRDLLTSEMTIKFESNLYVGQGWGQVKYLYLILGTWCKISSTWYLLVLDTLKFKSTWYLLVLEGKVLGTCPSTFKYFCQINMYIQA